MRDLKADLALCEAATPGPWEWTPDNWNGGFGGIVGKDNAEVLFPDHRNEGDYGDAWFEEYPSEADGKFIVEAREGWPEAIRRAIKAEKECTELRTVFEEMTNTIDSAIRYCISGDCDGTLDPRIWCELISKARQILGE